MTGKLYGVGVGPGEPELLTLKAVRMIKECDVVGIPAKEPNACTAYGIARKAVPEIIEKPVLAVPVPMTTDEEVLRRCYDEGAKRLLAELRKGRTVAFLNLGDCTVYGTYMRLHERVLRAGGEAEIVSGVPSFCAVAGALGIALAEGKEQVHVLPGFYGVEDAWELKGTKVIMKAAGKTEEVKKALIRLEEEKGEKAYAVTDCGMDGECIYRDVRELKEGSGYFTTVVVKEG